MNKVNSNIALILFLSQTNVVYAESIIRGTAGLSHHQTKVTAHGKMGSGFDSTIKETDIDLQYYINPVEIKSHPWREARFLERSSLVATSAGYNKVDYGIKSDGPNFSFGGLYSSKSNPFIAGLNYSHSQSHSDFLNEKWNTNDISASFGTYLSYPLAIVALYSQSHTNYSIDNLVAGTTKDKSTTYGLSAKYVREFSSQQALSLVFTVTKTKDNEEGLRILPIEKNSRNISLDATYYITPKIGLLGTVSVNSADYDIDKSKTYSAGIDAFVTRNLSVTGIYVATKADKNTGSDTHGFTIAAKWWF